MANEKVNKIVVNGGSRRIGRLLNLASYVVILLSSAALIYLGERRGIDSTLNLIYYVALGVNAVQVLYFFVTWIIEGSGVFIKKRKTIEMIINFVWIAVIIAELVVGSITSIAGIRMDLLLITVVQLLIIMFVFKASNAIENSVNVKYGSGDFDKREKKKVVRFSLIFILLTALQISVLFIPKLPPQIDDLFSENRALEYVYDSVDLENGETVEGYFVNDIYYGLNESVVIPSTYNNRPVVGIKAKAIYDSGTITSLVLGEYVDGVLQSNLKVIEGDGINLNHITSLEIPSSLLKIEENAVTSNSLESLTISSLCDLNLDAFNTPGVEVINLNSEDVVDINFGHKAYKLKVPEKFYNSYREINYDDRTAFDIEGSDNKVVIDFETNCGVYLQSLILTKDAGRAFININHLKNQDQETSTFITDTVNYINTLGSENDVEYIIKGSTTNPGYVFYGWYRDVNFNQELDFSKEITITEDTVIYAKWEKIYTVNLDWGSDLKPYDEKITEINYVKTGEKSENIYFPTLKSNGGDITRVGYTNLSWEYNGNTYTNINQLVKDNPDIEDDAVLNAKWEMEKPVVDVSVFNDTVKLNSTEAYTDEFDGLNKYYNASMSHDASSENDFTLKYVWSKDGSVIAEYLTDGEFSYTFRNCDESGIYTLEVIADNGHGVTSSTLKTFRLRIEKADINDETLGTPEKVSGIYSGESHNVNYSLTADQRAIYDVSIWYDLDNDGNFESSTGPVNYQESAYDVKVVISRKDNDSANYNEKYIYTTVTIAQKELTATWKENYSVMYQANEPLVPKVEGLVTSDANKKITFKTEVSQNGEVLNKAVNVGEYVTTITGIDFGSNPENYKLSSNIVYSQSWHITPRELTATWSTTELTYAGKTQYAELVINGFWSFDASDYADSIANNEMDLGDLFSTIGGTDFIYDIYTKTYKIRFGMKDADTYKFGLTGLGEELELNYDLKGATTCEAIINEAPLSLYWSDLIHTYNANVNKANLKISGFMESDFNNITRDDFSYVGEEYLQEVYRNTLGVDSIVIAFGATNKGEYEVGLSGLNLNNYELSTIDKTNTLTINPLQLTGEWIEEDYTYNGLNQSKKYVISNIPQSQLQTFSLDDFNATIDANIENSNEVICKVEDGKLVLEFLKKDANDYNLSIEQTFSNLKRENYTFTTTTKTFTINKRPLEISWSNDSLTYNGATQEVTPSVNNLCDGDSLTFGVSGNNAKDAGNYVATITAISNSNYELLETDKSHNWIISPKDLYYEFSYDPQNIPVYNGKYQYQTITITGFEVDDLKTSNSDNNFNNSLDILNVFNFSATSKVNKWKTELVDGAYKLSFGSIDSGDHTITIIGVKDSNYNAEYIARDYTYSIDKAEALIKWDYVEEFTYSGTNHVITPTAYTVNNGEEYTLFMREDTSTIDSISLGVFDNKMKDAGNYKAYVTNNEYTNYFVNFSSVEWTIAPKKLTYSWTTLENYIYNSEEQDVIFEVSGFVNNEENLLVYSNFNYWTSEPSNVSRNNKMDRDLSNDKVIITVKYTNAGIYDSHFSYVNSNYYFEGGITEFSNEIKIEKYELTFDDWTDTLFTYNAKHQQQTLTPTNVFSGDTVELVYEIISKDEVVSEAINAGSYTINCVGVLNDNYSLPTLTEKTYNIHKKELSLVWKDTTSIVVEEELIEYIYSKTYYGYEVDVVGYVTLDDAYNGLYEVVNGSDLYAKSLYGVEDYEFTATHYFYALDAGTYIVSLGNVEDENNYYFTQETKSFKINPRVLDLEWHNITTTYNSESQSIYVSASNVVSGDEINFSYEGSGSSYSETAITGNTAIDAGEYTVKVTETGNTNYILPSDGLISPFTITRKLLEHSWSGSVKTYNGEHQVFTSSLRGLYESDYDDINLEYLNIEHNVENVSYENGCINVDVINAGEYSFANSEYNFNNYYINSYSTFFTVDQLVLEIKWDNPTYTYDGNYHEISARPTNLKGDDELTLVYENNSKVNAGTYTAKVTSIEGISSSNYKLPASVTKSWTISKRLIDVTWAYSDPFTYDGYEKSIYATINNLCTNFESNTLDVVNLTYSNNIKTNAGTYSASISGVDNSNYTYSISQSAIWKINPITLTVSDSSTVENIYDGQSKSNTITISGFLPNDIGSVSLSSFYYTYAGGSNIVSGSQNGNEYQISVSGTNVGNYNVNLSSTSLTNYVLENATNSSVVINQRELNVMYSQQNPFIYNGLEQSVVATISGFVPSDLSKYSTSSFQADSSFTLTTEDETVKLKFSAINAGTYDCDVLKIYDSNYSLTATSDRTFEIEKALLQYQWTNNVNKVYDGTQSIVTLTVTGIMNLEDVKLIERETLVNTTDIVSNNVLSNTFTISVGGTNAGTYTLEALGTTLDNYVTTAGSRTVTIEKREVSIIWTPQNEFTYDGEYHGVTASFDGFIASDLENLTLNCYNYTSSASWVGYNSDNNSIYFSEKTAGTYEISRIGLSSNYSFYHNYTIKQNNTSFEIKKAKLSIEWSGTPIAVYNGNVHQMVGTISGIIPADMSSVSTSNFTYNTNGSVNYSYSDSSLYFTAIEAGEYSIKDIVMNHPNYELTDMGIEFEIIKNPLYGTWSTESKYTYNGEEQYAVLTVLGFISVGNISTYNFTFRNGITPIIETYTNGTGFSAVFKFPVKNVGTYSVGIEAISEEAFPGYDFSSTYKTVTVLPKELTVELPTKASSYYTGSAQNLVFKIHGFSVNDINDFALSDFDLAGDFSSDTQLSVSGDTILISTTLTEMKEYNYTLNACEFGNYYMMSSSFQYEITPYTSFILEWSSNNNSHNIYTGSEYVVTLTISGIESEFMDKMLQTELDQTTSSKFEISYSRLGDSITYTFTAKNVGGYRANIKFAEGIEYTGSQSLSAYVYIEKPIIYAQLPSNKITDLNDMGFIFTSNNININLVRDVDYIVEFYSGPDMVTMIEPTTSGFYYCKIVLTEEGLKNVNFSGVYNYTSFGFNYEVL